MFNVERLLGQMVGDAITGQLGGGRRKQHHQRHRGGFGLPSGAQAQVGMGLLGLAFAAFEHFQGQNKTASTQPVHPASATPPPAPYPAATPPPPPKASATPEHALHLLRAMICAAHADGLIDADEHKNILGRAREAGLNEDELHTLDIEIRAPFTLPQLVARTPDNLRDEVYAAALISISADSDAEKLFLEQLATQLNLDANARATIHQQLNFA